MSNALHENLANVRIETDDGDLLPAMGVAGEKLAQLILAVSANQKPGTLTLKITVRPSTAGALAVKADVATKLPKGLPAETLLWPTPDGNLIGNDPRQEQIDLRTVPASPVRELKSVN